MGVQNKNSTNYVHPNEPNLLDLHNAMEYNNAGEPVLRVLTYSSGGSMDLTALSVVTDTALDGGRLEYDNTTGVFTFRPADLQGINLGNFVINGPSLQTLSGTIVGADIVLNPNGGSVQVPSLKIGTGGNILDTTLYIEAFITTYELVSIVDHSNTEALGIGVYGNINGVPTPWTVFELAPGVSGTPVSAVEIDDILTGVGIIPSVVVDRGTGIYSNYVIVNLDLEGLGQVLPITGAVFNLTRPLNKANLNIQSATNTDIFLDSQGLGDVIVNTNILPLTTNISTLGSPSKRWKSVYVGPGTIYVLDETLGVDQAIGARDGLLYIQNGAGLRVGEFTLQDNTIRITDSTRDIEVGVTTATGRVLFNRPIAVNSPAGQITFNVDRNGLTTINAPSSISTTQSALTVTGNTAGYVRERNFPDTLLALTGKDGVVTRVNMDSFGAGSYSVIASRQANGTAQNPTSTLNNDTLLRLSTQGWGTTNYISTIGRINIQAAQDFTDTQAGTRVRFQLTPTGSVTIQTVTADITSTGLSFVGNATGGITFSNGDRLTYFPTPVSQADKWLKSNGTTMSWQTLPVTENPLIYKGAWNAFTNHPPLTQTTANDEPAVSGWEYSIEATGTRDLGNGSQTYEQGGFVIYNGSSWEYIPPLNGVSSIRFDGGSAYTGAVLVQSFDIVNTLASNSLSNDKLANSSVTVTAGTGLSGGGTVELGASITLANAGVLSITTNTGLSTNVSATGNVTITNTGVLSVASGGHITATTVGGVVTLGSDATTTATNNTIALRDSDGGLTAKDFTATLDASISSDHGPFNYGVLSYSDTGIMADFSYNVNGYNQVVIQNRNAGGEASTNFIVSNNQGTKDIWYGEFGMNSSGFTGTGSLALPNAVYLNSISSPLVLGGTTLHVVIDDGSTDVLTIDNDGIATFANQVVADISGSSNNVRHAVTFATSGGSAPNSTFNGSSALTVDYSTVGAQAPLSSGVNIKTVNNNNLVGSGNVSVGTVTSISASGSVSGLTLGISGGGSITTTGTVTLTGSITGLTTSNLSSTANIANGQLANSSVTVTAGTGMSGGGSVSLGGTVTLTNAGVTSAVAGTGIGVSGSTGAVTITNTGVTSIVAGTNVTISGSTGAVTINSTAYSGYGNNTLYYALNATLTIGNTTANTMYNLFGVGATVLANTRYEVELEIAVNGPTASRSLFGFDGVATPTRISFWADNTTSSNNNPTVVYSTKTSGFATGVNICGANVQSTVYSHRIKGIVDIGATGGTFTALIGFIVNGTGVTVNPQSWMRLTPLGATGANTVIGTWA